MKLSKPPGCNLEHVKELFDSSVQLNSAALTYLSLAVIQVIKDQGIIISNKVDIPCWTASSNGKFSISSAWQTIRTVRPTSLSAKYIWHRFLPKHISVFIWRLFQHRIPIDEALWSKGIQLASKCACCSTGHMETFLHIFLESNTAAAIWDHFSREYAIPSHCHSIQQVCMSW